MVTDDQFTNANVIFGKTNRATRRYFADLFRSADRRPIPVVTGFIGSTSDGQTTTIGRNGSGLHGSHSWALRLRPTIIEDLDRCRRRPERRSERRSHLRSSCHGSHTKKRWSCRTSAPRCFTLPRLLPLSQEESRCSSRTRSVRRRRAR